MNKRRHRSDDLLFISALVALLLGLALLMYTTHPFVGIPRVWPILVMAAGGVLLYFAFVRSASFYFLFFGFLFSLEGAFSLALSLFDWRLARTWPLGMVIVGVAGLVSGLASKRRLGPLFAVPSIGFAVLGCIFSAFSFGLVTVNFRRFIEVWWPTLLIVGGISLFVAYGLSRRVRANANRAPSATGHSRALSGDARAESPKRRRGPTAGP